MKRMHFFALSGAIATATIALGISDASAEYRRGAVGVAAYNNLYVGGVYRRTARRAYRRAAYAGVIAPGIGDWNSASYAGLPGWGGARAMAVGAAAASNAAGYSAYGAYGDNYGSFDGGMYRRSGEAYYRPSLALTRAVARRIAFVSPDQAAAWSSYPTRAEFVRGYVTPGYAGYYGPRCNPLVDIGCY
jgi:hypothetical protein